MTKKITIEIGPGILKINTDNIETRNEVLGLLISATELIKSSSLNKWKIEQSPNLPM